MSGSYDKLPPRSADRKKALEEKKRKNRKTNLGQRLRKQNQRRPNNQRRFRNNRRNFGGNDALRDRINRINRLERLEQLERLQALERIEQLRALERMRRSDYQFRRPMYSRMGGVMDDIGLRRYRNERFSGGRRNIRLGRRTVDRSYYPRRYPY
ncbi:hypothetical protein QTN25_004540 [Entamoeba marina]